MQQPPKKNKITVKRAMQVADSLMNVGNKKLRLGDSQKKYIGKNIDSLIIWSGWNDYIKYNYDSENGLFLTGRVQWHVKDGY